MIGRCDPSEFAEAIRHLPDMNNPGDRYNTRASIDRSDGVHVIDFEDGNTIYALSTIRGPKMFFPDIPTLHVVEIYKDVCGQYYEEIDVLTDDSGKSRAAITRSNIYSSDIAERHLRRYRAINQITGLIFGKELHSHIDGQMTWEARKAWLELENQGEAYRYLEDQMFHWRFAPKAERGRRSHR